MTKLFVYGSLKKGKFNHGWLGKAECLGDDMVKGFSLISLNPHYPHCIKETDGSVGGVEGEIYEVPDATMQSLDRMEQGAGYFRQEVTTLKGETVSLYITPNRRAYDVLPRFSNF